MPFVMQATCVHFVLHLDEEHRVDCSTEVASLFRMIPHDATLVKVGVYGLLLIRRECPVVLVAVLTLGFTSRDLDRQRRLAQGLAGQQDVAHPRGDRP